jgi:hypothetical protein
VYTEAIAASGKRARFTFADSFWNEGLCYVPCAAVDLNAEGNILDQPIGSNPLIWWLTWIKNRLRQGMHYKVMMMSVVELAQHGALPFT